MNYVAKENKETIVAKSATLEFPSRKEAKMFCSQWSLATLTGHALSATKKDGSAKVTVYNLTESRLDMLKRLCS